MTAMGSPTMNMPWIALVTFQAACSAVIGSFDAYGSPSSAVRGADGEVPEFQNTHISGLPEVVSLFVLQVVL